MPGLEVATNFGKVAMHDLAGLSAKGGEDIQVIGTLVEAANPLEPSVHDSVLDMVMLDIVNGGSIKIDAHAFDASAAKGLKDLFHENPMGFDAIVTGKVGATDGARIIQVNASSITPQPHSNFG